MDSHRQLRAYFVYFAQCFPLEQKRSPDNYSWTHVVETVAERTLAMTVHCCSLRETMLAVWKFSLFCENLTLRDAAWYISLGSVHFWLRIARKFETLICMSFQGIYYWVRCYTEYLTNTKSGAICWLVYKSRVRIVGQNMLAASRSPHRRFLVFDLRLACFVLLVKWPNQITDT